MTRYRHALPQVGDALFLTDGGLETTLVFLEGVELPCFAAFPLLDELAGRERLARYFAPYMATARRLRLGFVLDTPTWRANLDWAAQLGRDAAAVAAVNRDAAAWARALAETDAGPRVVVNGVVGPRGDGYRPETRLGAEEAEGYHALQIAALAEGGVDMVSALTMTHPEEAIGIARAATANEVPSVISFTVETDGRLPTGGTLGSAIEEVEAATGGSPAYYMINCAHPSHFDGALDDGGPWLDRLRGLRANASAKSHAELDAATDLDAGDPQELAAAYRALRRRLPGLTVLGGCCGTDHRHVTAIAQACLAA